jgi:2-(1,2-epoxy-1,2-dihydrophenyl)acetyl-CoA isomerase
MADSPLIVEYQGAVAYLRFNRPQVLNALNLEMAGAFLDACQSVATDSTVRVLVLSGMGRAFMAGGDLQALRDNPESAAAALIAPLHKSVQLLAAMKAPVIASVHGAVAGAGLSLMMGADLAIAAEGTKFNFAYTAIGASCDGGASWGLSRLLGLRKAMEIALLGESFDAEQALRMGLLNRVVPGEQLTEATAEMACRLTSYEPHALAHLKQLLRAAPERSLEAQLQAEEQAFLDCAARPEFKTAIDDFYARRS